MNRRRLPLLLLPLILLGCSESTGPDGLCIVLVNVDGVHFTEMAGLPPGEDDLSDEPYVTVTRNTGCLDEGQSGGELSHGESNYLPVGTDIFEIDGFDASERLAYFDDFSDTWQVLAPLP